jgi:hypothetical protein
MQETAHETKSSDLVWVGEGGAGRRCGWDPAQQRTVVHSDHAEERHDSDLVWVGAGRACKAAQSGGRRVDTNDTACVQGQQLRAAEKNQKHQLPKNSCYASPHNATLCAGASSHMSQPQLKYNTLEGIDCSGPPPKCNPFMSIAASDTHPWQSQCSSFS